ncbi:MAG: XdhC family protein [Deltaproteobacteria bacterium]|nr:XdhC family protein [Deltaproteobacteria bacterium]
MDDFFERIAALLKRHPRIVLATVVSTGGSAPREAGARMAVLPDGSIIGTVGGGTLEKRVIEDALEVLREDRPRLARYELTDEQSGGIGAECGGRSEVFLEPVGSAPHLLILGAGHVGLALARLGRDAGYRITVVDDRPEFAEQAELTHVEVVRAATNDPSLRDLVTEQTAVAVLTRSHLLDRESLRNLLGTDAFYIGMIGSRTKVAKEMALLREEGFEEGVLEGVHAPIGLDIGAETPVEIAVAILAEIVAVRRQGRTPEASLTSRGR